MFNITEQTSHRILFISIDPALPPVLLRNMGLVYQALLDWLYTLASVEDINGLYMQDLQIAIEHTSVEIVAFHKPRSYIRRLNSLGWFVVFVQPETAAYIKRSSAEDRSAALADLVMMPQGIRDHWEATY